MQLNMNMVGGWVLAGWTIMSGTQRQHHIYSSTLVFSVLTTLTSTLLLALVCSWGWFFYQKCCAQGEGDKLRAKGDDLPGKIDVTNGTDYLTKTVNWQKDSSIFVTSKCCSHTMFAST
jgi:hypothetical protein